ncbi:MAG: rarD [Paucimonas sp.]|nr:rarD [Paucimonas sp.]
MAQGMLYAASAFVIWGLFPLYFKALGTVPAIEILAHRVFWSLVFVALVLAARRQWQWLAQLRSQPRVVGGFALSAALLALNWCIYIWAIQHDRIVDASLGYFINPLLNVLIGFVLLKERLRPAQTLAVAIATCGVAWLTWHAGSIPWIALSLALTFAFYGLLRKTAKLGPLEGLALESMVLAPVGLLYIGWLALNHQGAFPSESLGMQVLIAASGPITAVPLLLFAAGARKIPLSVLGLLQYIGPSLQLALGLFLFHEPFGHDRQVGFALIWTALALYSAESAWRGWGRRGSEEL